MYAPEKAKYPNRLILGTETYHDTNHWLAVRDNEYVIGEFVWLGYDYLGEDGVWPKRGWDAGIIDMAGTEYPEYYLRKSYWSMNLWCTLLLKHLLNAKVNGIPAKLFRIGTIAGPAITCCPCMFIPTVMKLNY
jgi:hypothetical protein